MWHASMESHTSRHTLLLFICITADAFARATMPVIMQSPQVRTAMPATASVRSLPTLKQPVVQVPVAVNPEAGTKTTAGAAAPADSTTTTTTPVTAKVPNLRSVEQLRREMADSEASLAETQTGAPLPEPIVNTQPTRDGITNTNAVTPPESAVLAPTEGSEPTADEVADAMKRQRDVMPQDSNVIAEEIAEAEDPAEEDTTEDEDPASTETQSDAKNKRKKNKKSTKNERKKDRKEKGDADNKPKKDGKAKESASAEMSDAKNSPGDDAVPEASTTTPKTEDAKTATETPVAAGDTTATAAAVAANQAAVAAEVTEIPAAAGAAAGAN